MKVLVVSATALEIKPFIQSLGAKRENISILVTGVGLTATTYSLTRQFALFKPDLAIQAGIGGCFDTTVPLGAVFAIQKDIIADEGVTEKGVLQTMADLKLVSPNKFPYKNGWLVNNSGGLKHTKLKKATAVSVNTISHNQKTIRQYREKFNPVVESMEGAAFHYVCLMEKIPFLQIRSISNYAGVRNKKQWNLPAAIHNLNQALEELLYKS